MTRRKKGTEPSVKDWTKLFDERRGWGIDLMPAKEHWFAERAGFEDEDVEQSWEEKDLADLWNMEGDDGWEDDAW